MKTMNALMKFFRVMKLNVLCMPPNNVLYGYWYGRRELPLPKRILQTAAGSIRALWFACAVPSNVDLVEYKKWASQWPTGKIARRLEMALDKLSDYD
jgi:hypothetical protein